MDKSDNNSNSASSSTYNNEDKNYDEDEEMNHDDSALNMSKIDENNGQIQIHSNDGTGQNEPEMNNQSFYISPFDISLLLSNNKQDQTMEPFNSDLKQLEQDKKAVYSHPLFPLLALLFEKCETATRSINSFETDSSLSSFNDEIEEFIQHQKNLGKPFFTNDSEVDSLMIKAIQVFRIHLLELEKVSELCKDFCHRYISCLKTKMRSDALIKGSPEIESRKSFHTDFLHAEGQSTLFGSNSSLSTMSSPNLSPAFYLSSPSTTVQSPASPASCLSVSSRKSLSPSNPSSNIMESVMCHCPKSSSSSSTSSSPPSPLSSSLPPKQTVDFDTILDPFFKSMSKCIQQQQQHSIDLSNLNDSTQEKDPNNDNSDDDDDDDEEEIIHDLSLKNKIEHKPVFFSTNSNDLNGSLRITSEKKNELPIVNSNTKNMKKIRQEKTATMVSNKTNKCIKSFTEKNLINNPSGNHPKRGVLPKQATSIMRSWLFQHIVHPYPTEDEKRAIASETNLTLLQVNNWFINARRRILQPMLDSANNISQNELVNSNLNDNGQRELDLSTKVRNSKDSANSSMSNATTTKKLKTYSQQMNRFWPQSLANIIQTNDNNKQNHSKL